jgi:hypothetical protein
MAQIYRVGKDIFDASTNQKIANPNVLATQYKGATEVNAPNLNVPTGATKITDPNYLKTAGLNESQIFRQGADIYKLPSVLSSDKITGATPVIPVADVPPSTTDAFIKGIGATTDAASLYQAQEAQRATEMAKKDTITSRVDELIAKKGTKGEALTEQEKLLGAPEQEKALAEAKSIMSGIKTSYDANREAQERRKGLAGSIYGRQALMDKKYAVEYGNAATVVNTLQGNLTAAKDSAKKTIDAEYESIENELDAKLQQLSNAYNDLSSADKKRADELSLVLGKQKDDVAAAKEEKKNIADVMLAASKNGADATTLKAILNSKDLASAITAAGTSLADKGEFQVIGQHYDENSMTMVNDYGFVSPNGTVTKADGTPYTGTTTVPGAEGSIAGADATSIANAIKKVESNGNYNAKGGSGENGAYQFMPSTWASWSKDYANQVLGKSIGNLPMTPENQDAVAQWKIQSWLDQGLNPQQIAAKWNSGSEVGWENKIGTNKLGVKYNVPAYVNKVTTALGGLMTPQSTEETNPTVIAWGNEMASTGKLPSGVPKNMVGRVSEYAKTQPKPDGLLIDKKDGLPTQAITGEKKDAYLAMYDLQKKSQELKELFSEMNTGIIAGTFGSIFPSETRTTYDSLRKQIWDLLARARTGAAINTSEEEHYKSMLPSAFNKSFFLGDKGDVKINNFIDAISGTLETKLDGFGADIIGRKKIINGQEYTRVYKDGQLGWDDGK